MKKLISILFLVVVFSSAQGQQTTLLKEKGIILKNQVGNLNELQKIAIIIDSDDESYWAFGQAEKLLKSVSLSGNNYHKDLAKIYAAYTHIFYGMSYTKSIMAISRGDEYSLSELNSTIIKDYEIKDSAYRTLSEYELSSIYSIINFYKVSRMPKYSDMNDRFKMFSKTNEQVFTDYPPESAYKIMSFYNKKLYFLTFVSLVNDLFMINNPNITESDYNKYIDELTQLGQQMDQIPSDYDTILALSDKEYYNYLMIASGVQKDMLGSLVDEMRFLRDGAK